MQFIHWKRVLAVFCVLNAAILHAQEAPEIEAEHEALRALRARVEKAINQQDLSALEACLTPEFAFTSSDQTTVTTPQELADFYQQMFKGEKAPLQSLQVELRPEILTRFLGPDTGYCFGEATEKYVLRDGRKLDFTARWTATVQKIDGQWLVAAAHVGVDFMHNPFLDRVKSACVQLAAGATLGGLALGALIVLLLVRMKQRRGTRDQSTTPSTS
jgi:ketosteroid isomerase-like protein